MHAPCNAAATPLYDHGDQALEAQVQSGLNLFLRLRNPAQMPALMATIGAHMDQVHTALEGLHYVHFARFLPTQDFSSLIVVTEFDGDLKSYIMDFVAVMGDIFTAILAFIQDAPRLPVNQYPQEFWAFVQANNMAQVQPWSAYKQSTVIELKGTARPLPPAWPDAPARPLALADIQGNILRGYRVHHARHFALAVGDAGAARAFLAGLVSGDEARSPQLTTAEEWRQRPEYFLNLGLTHGGLQALGVAPATLGLFPPAFQQGPAQRAAALGDTEGSAPEHWEVGRSDQTAHLLLSLYTDEKMQHRLDGQSARLRALFAQHGLKVTWCHDATALPGGAVHFGYKDGIAQPRIAGVPGRQASDMQPASGSGEFLLGAQHVNQYGGNFAGDLPAALADNGSYAALRLLAQDVAGFEALLSQAAAHSQMDKELIAAKMMGRWRDGTPLTLGPECPLPHLRAEQLNRFDYAPNSERPAYFDDAQGLRCPVGSHMRRLNPRGALVTGKPHSRRLIRRGVPYGPAFDPAQPDDGTPRGLLGLFICGDLEMQFEFLMGVWANDDIATAGLRGTRDPILGAQPPQGGRFDIPTSDLRHPVRIVVPRLVHTRGSLYVFIPGVQAVRHLAAGAFSAAAANAALGALPNAALNAAPTAAPVAAAGPRP